MYKKFSPKAISLEKTVQEKKVSESKLFYTLSVDQLIPHDNPVRKISKELDLSFLYEQTREYYSHEGKPSIDPVVLFKLNILGYFFGIPSERQLFSELQVNLAYRWYLGYDLDEQLPDHSIMTKSHYLFALEVFKRSFLAAQVKYIVVSMLTESPCF